MPKPEEFVSEEIFSTVSLLLRTASSSHRYWISMCFALPQTRSACCGQRCTGVNVQPNRNDSHLGLWQTPELPSTLLLHGCQRTVLLLRCWWQTMLCCFVQTLIGCFPCRIMPSLTDFLDCLSPAQSASARAYVIQVLCVRLRDLCAQLHGGERNVGPVLGQIVQPRRDRTEHGGLHMPQLGVGAAWSPPWLLLLA